MSIYKPDLSICKGKNATFRVEWLTFPCYIIVYITICDKLECLKYFKKHYAYNSLNREGGGEEGREKSSI